MVWEEIDPVDPCAGAGMVWEEIFAHGRGRGHFIPMEDGDEHPVPGELIISSSWNGSLSKQLKRQVATPPMPGKCAW
jgi:hypothetical protein